MFEISSNTPYFVTITGYACCTDTFNANFLRMSVRKYKNILKKFNAYTIGASRECYFLNYDDVKKCVDYLNEKYGIMIELMKG